MKTLQHLAVEFVEFRRRDCPAQTIASDKSVVDFFVRWLAKERVNSPDEIRSEHITKWLIHVSSRPHFRSGLPRKPGTLREEKMKVRVFVRWLVRLGYLAPSVLEAFPMLRRPMLAQRAAMKHAEVRGLIRRLPKTSPRQLMLHALVEAAYSTALRPCELLRLDVGDYYAERGLLRVRGKGEKERLVPIGKRAAASMDNYIAAIRPLLAVDPRVRALWLNFSGRRLGYDRLLVLLREHLGECRKYVSWYSFRRACATELARSGANLWAIKEILGHEHLDTLKHYINFSLDDLKRAHARCHPRNLTESFPSTAAP